MNARNIVFDDSGIALDDKEFFKCLRRFAVTDPSLLSRNDIGDNDGNNSNDEDDVDDDDLMKKKKLLLMNTHSIKQIG